MRRFLKVIGVCFTILFSLIFILYLSLCIYIKSKEVKVDKSKLLEATNVSLSDRQILIASLVLNKSSHPEFRNYFFLIHDAFSSENRVALNVAFSYIGKYEGYRVMNSIDRQIADLATKRYIMKHIDYRICYNYLFSNIYFGANMFGLLDASRFYYQKDYKKLDDKEFISLCLRLTNPHLYYGYENIDYDSLDEEHVESFKKQTAESIDRRNKKIEEICSKLEK